MVCLHMSGLNAHDKSTTSSLSDVTVSSACHASKIRRLALFRVAPKMLMLSHRGTQLILCDTPGAKGRTQKTFGCCCDSALFFEDRFPFR